MWQSPYRLIAQKTLIVHGSPENESFSKISLVYWAKSSECAIMRILSYFGLYVAIFSKKLAVFSRFKRQFWRALIWQKISWKQQQTKTGKSETGRKDCHEDENVGVVKLSTFVEFFRPCQANSVLLKPLKAVQRPLETFDCFMISMAKWNWAPNGIHCYLLTGCD